MPWWASDINKKIKKKNAAGQWLYVNLVCRFHTHLGRIYFVHSGFLLHLKIRILPNLLIVHPRTHIHSRCQSAVHSIPRMGNSKKMGHAVSSWVELCSCGYCKLEQLLRVHWECSAATALCGSSCWNSYSLPSQLLYLAEVKVSHFILR